MRTKQRHLPEHAGTEIPGRQGRSALFFLLSVLVLILGSGSALSAGIGHSQPMSAAGMFRVVAPEPAADNAIRNTDNALSADSSPSTRLNVSRLVQRLQVRPGSQQRSQNSKMLPTPLPVWAGEPEYRFFPWTLPDDVLTASSRFQILLRTVLPIRAGPLC